MIKYDNYTLEKFTKDISDTEEDKANHSIEMVEEAIKNYDWTSVNLNRPKVKLKGSYHNGTNVKIDSDVDIYVLFSSYYKVDTDNYSISNTHIGDGYDCEYHRIHLQRALENRFGNQLHIGKKAFKLPSTTYKHETDIVGAVNAIDDKGRIGYNGITSFFNDGTKSFNYPEQDKINSDNKDRFTNEYYKKMVRIFKGIKNDLNLNIPSFLIECMVFNIVNDYFIYNNSYLDKTKNIIKIWKNNLPNNSFAFLELNGIKKLFSTYQKWNVNDAIYLINKIEEVIY